MKIVLALAMLFNPLALVKRAVTNTFYAITNFYVDHIQPNQKGEPGKVVASGNTTEVKSESQQKETK